MEFKVIPNEQTPRVPEIPYSVSKTYVDYHATELQAFLEYAKTHEDAVGLAANQCSIDDERFMMRVFALRNMITREWSLVIDPHITEYIGIKDIKAEGCLTWKGRVIVAERYRGVKVMYFDINGMPYQGKIYNGFEAQIWQHEINHLDGVEEDVHDMFAEPPPISVGRNEPCPCSSGKKYKKCCLLLI